MFVDIVKQKEQCCKSKDYESCFNCKIKNCRLRKETTFAHNKVIDLALRTSNFVEENYVLFANAIDCSEKDISIYKDMLIEDMEIFSKVYRDMNNTKEIMNKENNKSFFTTIKETIIKFYKKLSKKRLFTISIVFRR